MTKGPRIQLNLFEKRTLGMPPSQTIPTAPLKPLVTLLLLELIGAHRQEDVTSDGKDEVTS